MLKIGLTGGIASGKTAATRLFARLGAGIVDTDVVAREVVRPGSAGLQAIVAEFGPGSLNAAGELDRGAMRRRVFAEPDARRRLEAILHPLIRRRTLELVEASRSPYVVIAVPLLVETDFGALVDRVLVVDCPPEVQIERLIERDAMSADEARRVMDAQTSRASRLAAADDVIDNSGTLDALAAQVEKLHAHYLELARDCPKPEGRAE